MRFFKHLGKGSMNVPDIFQNFAAFNSSCIDIITTVIFGYLRQMKTTLFIHHCNTRGRDNNTFF